MPTLTRLPSNLAEKPLRVLVVDDHEDSADLICMQLESRGHSVRVAYDSDGALRESRAFMPDVALVDLWLGGAVSGFDIARHLHELRGDPGCRIVALSGLPRELIEAEAKQAGISFHRALTKPVAIEALLEAIEGDELGSASTR